MRALTLLFAIGCAAAQRPETLLSQAVRFPTVAGNDQARKDQQAWLLKTAADLGLPARDAGPVTEIELPGPAGAPVLGLVVHGDVQPVDEKEWTFPPFGGVIQGGYVYGRGAADDKAGLVDALLAMHALKGAPLTQTVRLLVGSDEESGSQDMKTYLSSHKPPDLTLVLDSEFPVVVGEKAWDGLSVTASDEGIVDLEAGLSPSIVPDRAKLTLKADAGFEQKLHAPDKDTRVELQRRGDLLDIVVHGRAAHAGVNIAGGRNALISLAHVVDGLLPDCPARDLLAFTDRVVELQMPAADGWRGWAINPATVKHAGGKYTLIVNLRRPPPWTAAQSREHLYQVVKAFSPRLEPGDYYFGDEPLVFDPNAKIVKRLMDDYAKATGEHPPLAVSGGGTYAKKLPNAIAFGMWFPGKPYPGHDVDEKQPIDDLHKGLDILTLTLRDLATSPPLQDPFAP
ncbi:MAG: M20/M25/M40 family metallo-hydrolase [Myxococcales bacterium]|nr:M20/M25/M40 family metallo-hydrolase [Myxococcales bacterium]